MGCNNSVNKYNSAKFFGWFVCGGSLITEKVVISAAHFVSKNQSGHLIGLGFHNLSGYSDWSEEEWRKHVIKEVKEIIVHERYNKDTDV